MAHLYKFRQGWQSETLARFLLSHFSFIAQPSTIADDVGSDFYCTLFRKEKVGKDQQLIPKNSFVIQIKSSATALDLSDKAEFLEQLELPFFIGVADRKKMKLRIFSGRGLQLLFTMKGIPKKLVIQPTPSIQNSAYYEIVNEAQGNYKLKFPMLVEIDVAHQDREMDHVYSILAKECALIHQNIASRRVSEFILTFGPGDTRIFAGQGSARQFRRNFALRLVEYFYNLEWISLNAPRKLSQDEVTRFSQAWTGIRDYLPRSERALVQAVLDRMATGTAGS
ncbi:MAG: hypothetical protein ACYCPQ_11035 [Elusimicrobiota bacterium]